MNIEDKRKKFMDWPEYRKHPELFSDSMLKRLGLKK